MMTTSPTHISLEKGKKIYFLSDFHLKRASSPDYIFERDDAEEKRIVQYISKLQKDAGCFFFLGDIFDIWIEYKDLIPKGNIRLQAKWLELKDKGIECYFIGGNHDVWFLDYFEKYLGMKCYKECNTFIVNNKHKLMIAHGDGLGLGDSKFKFYKRIFHHPLTHRISAFFPTHWIYGLVNKASKKRQNEKKKNPNLDSPTMLAPEKEWLIQFAITYLKKIDNHIDYFIFGHRHIPIEYKIPNTKSTYINTGTWINFEYSYATFDGIKMSLNAKAAKNV